MNSPYYLNGLHDALDAWGAQQAAALTLSGRVPGMAGHPHCMGGRSPIYCNDTYAYLGNNGWLRGDDRRFWEVMHNSNALGFVHRLAVTDDFGDLRAVTT